MRTLHRGEQIALRCGLSLTVPTHYRGYYAEGAADATGFFDVVSSSQLAPKGLMESFSAQSVTPASEKGMGSFRWPMITTSEDKAVEVHCAGLRLGTAKAVEFISVVVRLPERPTGLVLMTVFGEGASAKPSRVMAQVNSMWALFSVQGAPLPSLAE